MSLIRSATVELPEHNERGGYDHAAIHSATNRLFVAHPINNSIDVVDCSADRYLASLNGLVGVAGVLVSELRGLVFTTNRGEDSISIFAPYDLETVAKIQVGIHPNGLAFNPQRGQLLCANVGNPNIADSATLSIVDIKSREMIHSIPLPGRPRWTIFDITNQEFYINISEPAQIIVVPAVQPDHIIRSFQVPAVGPHGLDMDPDTGRLFCACDEGKLVTLESSSGKIINTTELSGKPDVIFYNRMLKHLYIAVGDPGVIDVFDTQRYTRRETVSTEKGAHTLAFDARYNKVYALAPQTHSAMVFIDE
jgi:DNA-binding beta-propeller fold protein YncE